MKAAGRKRWLSIGAVAGLLVIPGCAGVRGMAASDRPLRNVWIIKPPYVRSLTKPPVTISSTSRVALLPVVNAPSLSRHHPLESDLGDLYEQIEQLVVAKGWTQAGPFAGRGPGGGPEIYLGREQSVYSPSSVFAVPDGVSVGILISGPESRWRAALADSARAHGYDFFLLLMVAAGQFPIYKGPVTSGVWLGTGHRYPILAANLFYGGDEVPAVTLCGALVNAHGEIVRVGGEGIFCIEPEAEPIRGWTIGGDLSFALERRELMEYRRDDLPGRPASWTVATQNLVAQLLGRDEWLLR